MTDSSYTPPKVWKWESASGGAFANINRPIAGPTHDKELPVGKHPLQLYSLATPNGVKVTVMLEELLERGFEGAEYDAYLIRITEGEQFSSGFVGVNPNSKIPAMVDYSTNVAGRAECMNWLFWQMGSAPLLGGGFGHFYAYAPEKYEYPINRYTMEIKRQLDVLDRQLADHRYVAGDQYTIADMAIWPWYGALVKNKVYEAAEFLEAHTYTNVIRWADELARRPAVQRGRMVNRAWGEPSSQLHERHDASDFELRTQDKLEPQQGE